MTQFPGAAHGKRDEPYSYALDIDHVIPAPPPDSGGADDDDDDVTTDRYLLPNVTWKIYKLQDRLAPNPNPSQAKGHL